MKVNNNTPPRMPVTTSIITYLVADPYKPSLSTLTGGLGSNNPLYSSHFWGRSLGGGGCRLKQRLLSTKIKSHLVVSSDDMICPAHLTAT